MTSAEYSMPHDEEAFKQMIDEDRHIHESMFTERHQMKKVYKGPKNKMPGLMKEAEKELIDKIEAKGGTVTFIESKSISNRRYKRNRAKILKKQAKKFA